LRVPKERTSCERCGDPSSGTLTIVPPNRSQAQPSKHHYCHACAIDLGVPLREVDKPHGPISEPQPPTWDDIRQHLILYETMLREDPSLQAQIQAFTHRLRRLADGMPGPMPSAVAAAFDRLRAAETG
jgi:hypothetical protein